MPVDVLSSGLVAVDSQSVALATSGLARPPGRTTDSSAILARKILAMAAGFNVVFAEEGRTGRYQLWPLHQSWPVPLRCRLKPVWDGGRHW